MLAPRSRKASGAEICYIASSVADACRAYGVINVANEFQPKEGIKQICTSLSVRKFPERRSYAESKLSC